MSGLFAITHSMVQSFERCRKQYWFGYLSGLERPEDVVSPPGLVGNGVHRALKTVCLTGDPEDGERELDAYLRMPAHECAGPGTEHYTRAMDLLRRGAEAHASIQSADRWAELDTWVPVHSRGVTLRARIDRADRLRNGEWQVIDWKTGHDIDEVTDAQLDLGHVAVRTTFQLPSETFVSAIGWNLRSGQVRVRRLRSTDAKATVKRYIGIANRIRTTTEFAATPNRACGFCAWRPLCPAADAPAASEWDWDDDEDEKPDPLPDDALA